MAPFYGKYWAVGGFSVGLAPNSGPMARLRRVGRAGLRQHGPLVPELLGLGAVADAVRRHQNPCNGGVRGNLVHDTGHDVFQDGPQAAGADLPFHGLFGHGLQRLLLKVQLHMIVFQELGVLLAQGVLGLRENLDQVLFLEALQAGNHRQTAHQFGDDAEFQQVMGLHLPEQLAHIPVLLALDLAAEADGAAVGTAADDLVQTVEGAAADKEDENGNKKAVLNKKETAIAQDRQELIKQKFSEWIWRDIDRRERLCRIYNETFNSIRPREYDGRHIHFEGMNPEISLRPHQVNAIAHVLYGGNTLLAHEVGAGKTYEMVAAAMEMKRLGLCTKSLIVVPNHITEQWAAEFLQLYPSANILVATKKDFEKQNRKKFCSRISTGDYDAIIIGHSQFEKIPMSAERQQTILQQQIDEILFGIEEAKSQKAERYTIKQMERTRKSLEAKLAKLNDQSRKDDVVTFEELGVDRIFIDESHYFKNLFLMTKMRNVGGIAQTEAQKSSDLFMKCQYLDELTGGRGVIFATGTPISNSMVELYTIQRYLQYRTLQEMGLIHFDDWASNFGETVTAIELSPEGYNF